MWVRASLSQATRFGFLIFANWLFHGFLYMDGAERAFFISLDALIFLPLFCSMIAAGDSVLQAAVVALLFGHSIHWLFNGHVYVLLKKMGFAHTQKKRFTKYLSELHGRACQEPSIAAVAAFGSLSRGKLTEHSDLDVRVIRHKGIVNAVRACCFTFLERCRALLGRFPLDIYTIDSLADELREKKLRSDESPVVVFDPHKILE